MGSTSGCVAWVGGVWAVSGHAGDWDLQGPSRTDSVIFFKKIYYLFKGRATEREGESLNGAMAGVGPG